MSKLFNILLIITSLLGYLQWGDDMHTFLFQAEVDVLIKLVTAPQEMAHPLVILPLLGQIILVFSLFRKKTSLWLIYLGAGFLALLLAIVLLSGVLGGHFLTALSTLPFFAVLALRVRYDIRLKKQTSESKDGVIHDQTN